MPWNQIQPADVTARFSTQEVGMLQNAFGGIQAAQDAIQPFITDETASAQGSVIAGGSQVGQVGTIADQLRPDVIAIVVWRLLITFPALKALQTDARKAVFDDAQKKLSDVANGKIKVEIPANAQQVTAPVNAAQVARPGRHVRTDEFDGLAQT